MKLNKKEIDILEQVLNYYIHFATTEYTGIAGISSDKYQEYKKLLDKIQETNSSTRGKE